MAAPSADAARPPRAWRWPPPLAHRLPPLRLELAAPPARLLHPWGALALLLRAPARLLDRVSLLDAQHHALLDRAAASLTQSALLFPAGFFRDGWGDADTPARLRRVLQGGQMRRVQALETDDVLWGAAIELPAANARVQQGHFRSTLPDADRHLPQESRDAFVELVTPLEWAQSDRDALPRGASNRPLVVLLPGTGEHGFLHRRASIALPLARMGIATLILEGPFYGRRRPSDQNGSKLRRVSDLPILGQATIEETKSLLAYFRDHYNFSRLVVAGSSMGGLHAAMTASVFPGEVGVTAWLAPPSAAPVFADGLLAGSCNWDLLYEQHLQSLPGLVVRGQDADKANSEDKDGDHVLEAKKRMREFLSVTDIDNFGPPQRTDAVVFVVGTEDMYLGSTEPQWTQLQDKWDQASVRYIKTGHVSGILLEDEAYRQTIVEVIRALQRTAPPSSEHHHE